MPISRRSKSAARVSPEPVVPDRAGNTLEKVDHGLDLDTLALCDGSLRQAGRRKKGSGVYAATFKLSDRQVSSQAY